VARWQRVWRGAEATHTTLSLLDLALRVIGYSTALGGVIGAVTWALANPYIALVAGLAVWVGLAVLLLVWMSWGRRVPATSGANQKGKVQQLTTEQDRLRGEIREQERERQQLISRAEQRESEIGQLRERNKQLLAERHAFKERAEQATKALEGQPNDEELKRRCDKLVHELSEFANERAQGHPQKRNVLNIGRRHPATKRRKTSMSDASRLRPPSYWMAWSSVGTWTAKRQRSSKIQGWPKRSRIYKRWCGV
jgi:hypothetical protein